MVTENNMCVLDEHWVSVFDPLYKDHYEVSSLGGVKRLTTKSGKLKKISRIMVGYKSSVGYKSVKLKLNNIQKGYFIHRLVYFSFHPSADQSLCVDHINGTKDDNRLENLLLVTPSMNTQLCYERNHNSIQKINQSEYNKILELHNEGISNIDISKIYKVNQECISKILTKKLGINNNIKLKNDDHIKILELFNEGYKQVEISRILNVSTSCIYSSIKNNRSIKKLNQISQTDYIDNNNILWKCIILDEIPSDYFINMNGDIKNNNNKILKSSVVNGYKIINLNKIKTLLIHRLVAIAFIPNPDNKPIVNHKDKNKLNNHISNLEWCTQKENMKHVFSKI